MTIEELYGKVLADDGLKESLAKAAKDGMVVEWFAEQGVEATEEELLAYARTVAQGLQDGQELSDDDLENVAGGVGYGSFMESFLYIAAGQYCY